MANNIFISYDLADPDATFDAVAAAIRRLGDWAQVQPTLWFVKTKFSSEEVASLLWPKLSQAEDSLTVIDASNNTAHWQNIDQDVAEFFQSEWNN